MRRNLLLAVHLFFLAFLTRVHAASVMFTQQLDVQKDLATIRALNIDVVMNYQAGRAFLAGGVPGLIQWAIAELDCYQLHRIKGLIDIPPELTTPGHEADLKQFVAAIRRHPALYGWYAFDEPQLTLPRATCEAAYANLKSWDPPHPVWVVYPGYGKSFWPMKEIAAYPLSDSNRICDVLGIDNYPVKVHYLDVKYGGGELTTGYDPLRYQVQLLGTYYATPSMYQRDLTNYVQVYTEFDPRSYSPNPFPTGEQIVSMADIGRTTGWNSSGHIVFWMWHWDGESKTMLDRNPGAQATVAAIALQFHEDLYPPQ